eukprot:scaffold117936_cov63-Phaeocystis_antarctica.AAC.5
MEGWHRQLSLRAEARCREAAFVCSRHNTLQQCLHAPGVYYNGVYFGGEMRPYSDEAPVNRHPLCVF